MDETTGYRCYSTQQVRQINTLMELKALGFSLAEIKTIIDGEIKKEVLSSQNAEKFEEMTQEERAWLLVKMICVEDVRIRQCLTEALWL